MGPAPPSQRHTTPIKAAQTPSPTDLADPCLPVQRRAGLSKKRFLPERTRGTHADTSPDKTNLNTQLPQSTTDELTKRTRRDDDARPERSLARDRVRTCLDFIAERSPGWMAYQILAGHEPGEAARVRQEAREAAVAALADGRRQPGPPRRLRPVGLPRLPRRRLPAPAAPAAPTTSATASSTRPWAA